MCSDPNASTHCRGSETDMRFVANENVSVTVIEQLRAGGHDVLSVKDWHSDSTCLLPPASYCCDLPETTRTATTDVQSM